MPAGTDARAPAVAGQFYPGSAAALRELVDELLAAAAPAPETAPKAVIAPHAGFMFSGAVAATAYRRLAPAAGTVERVVILGPSHFHPISGLASHSADAFVTPLGPLPVDRPALDALLDQAAVTVNDRAHAREHSIETQLPFVQRVLGDVAIVPLVVGDATPEQVGHVLAALWGGPETVIAISSDLSHFHPDAEARRLDETTAEIIEQLRMHELGPDNACGFLPIAGLLANARRIGGLVRTLELRNSADAGAAPDSVVGYGAFELAAAAA